MLGSGIFLCLKTVSLRGWWFKALPMHSTDSTSCFPPALAIQRFGALRLSPGILLFGWTPRLCLSNSKFRSLTRFLLDNNISLVGPLRYYFWVGLLDFAFQIRNLVPQRDSYYTTIFLMAGPLVIFFLFGPLAFAFQFRKFDP